MSSPSYPVNVLKQYIRKEQILDVSRSMLYSVRKDATADMIGSEKE